jgi:hypothetical protein
MSTVPPPVAETSAPPARNAPPPCAWRSWPLAERGWRRCLLPALLAAVALLVGLATGRPGWALAAAFMLAIAAWRYFVPVLYELGTLGVTQQVFSRQRRVPWRSLGRYEIRSAGVFLSPHSEPGPLDAFVGFYLPWCDHKDEVMANIEFYLAGAASRQFG